MISPSDNSVLQSNNDNATAALANHPLQQFLEDSAENHPSRIAIMMHGHAISFSELNALTDSIAAGLYATGFTTGDRASIFMPNCPQFVIAYYGILKAGGVVVTSNPLQTERELAHQLADSQVETTFVLNKQYERLKKVQPQTRIRRVICSDIKEYLPTHLKLLLAIRKEKTSDHHAPLHSGDIAFQDLLTLGAKRDKLKHILSGDDSALLKYGGASSDSSKAIILTHRSVVAEMITENSLTSDGTTYDPVPVSDSYDMATAIHNCIRNAVTMLMMPRPPAQARSIHIGDTYAIIAQRESH